MTTHFPHLSTDRLDLIEIQQVHLYDFFKLFSDERVSRYYNILPFKEVKEAQNYLDLFDLRVKRKTGIRWGIALKGKTTIIGTIGFNSYQRKHQGNFAYDLQFDYWNRGIVTEASKEVLKYGFENLEINRIDAEVMIGNEKSERVLEKLGFEFEGVLRDWRYWNDTYYDIKMFSLLKKDYNNAPQK